MVTITLILVGFALSFLFDKTTYTYALIIFMLSTSLLIHIVSVTQLTYEYNVILLEREKISNNLESYLTHLRNESIDPECGFVKLLQSVQSFNYDLNKLKEKNKTLFFDQYIDDRIITINPINIDINQTTSDMVLDAESIFNALAKILSEYK